jgi:hypothetical protein
MSATLSPFGTSRSSAVCAVGQFALFGTSRRWAVRAFSRTRAVQRFAPFQRSAPLGNSRLFAKPPFDQFRR